MKENTNEYYCLSGAVMMINIPDSKIYISKSIDVVKNGILEDLAEEENIEVFYNKDY